MTPARAEPRTWPVSQWWLLIAVILAAQVGIIFWLSARATVRQHLTKAGPNVHQWPEDTPLPAGAVNPTLLALPNPDGFSGPVWLRFPVLEPPQEAWRESPRLLQLQTNGLGGDLVESVRDSLRQPLEIPAKSAPRPTVLDFISPVGLAESSLTVEGDLTNRALLSTFQLNSWPSTSLLADSVVQIAVDGEGRVAYLPGLKDTGSGSKEADAYALEQARKARFQPLRRSGASPAALTWGRLVFHWRTVPVPATNTPTGGGQ